MFSAILQTAVNTVDTGTRRMGQLIRRYPIPTSAVAVAVLAIFNNRPSFSFSLSLGSGVLVGAVLLRSILQRFRLQPAPAQAAMVAAPIDPRRVEAAFLEFLSAYQASETIMTQIQALNDLPYVERFRSQRSMYNDQYLPRIQNMLQASQDLQAAGMPRANELVEQCQRGLRVNLRVVNILEACERNVQLMVQILENSPGPRRVELAHQIFHNTEELLRGIQNEQDPLFQPMVAQLQSLLADVRTIVARAEEEARGVAGASGRLRDFLRNQIHRDQTER